MEVEGDWGEDEEVVVFAVVEGLEDVVDGLELVEGLDEVVEGLEGVEVDDPAVFLAMMRRLRREIN